MKQRGPSWLERSRRVAARVWLGIREWCGDAAYERYVRSQRQRTRAATVLLTREEFYVEQLQKRYSRVSRCC